MKSFLLIGLGKFGHYLCRSLAQYDCEIMIVDEVIGSLIRKEKFSTTEIEDAMQSRMDRGNLSLMNSLANAVIKGKITLIQAEKQIDETKYPLLTRTIRQLEK